MVPSSRARRAASITQVCASRRFQSYRGAPPGKRSRNGRPFILPDETDEMETRGEGSTMIAVLGAAGHVGGTVAGLLLEQNEEIRVLEHVRSLRHFAERGAQVVRGDA